MSGNPIFLAPLKGQLLSHGVQRALAFLDLFADKNMGA